MAGNVSTSLTSAGAMYFHGAAMLPAIPGGRGPLRIETQKIAASCVGGVGGVKNCFFPLVYFTPENIRSTRSHAYKRKRCAVLSQRRGQKKVSLLAEP